jgi:hypothetical protein
VKQATTKETDDEITPLAITCAWPNSKLMDGFDYIYQAEEGAHAFIVYEVRTSTGKRFRNGNLAEFAIARADFHHDRPKARWLLLAKSPLRLP